MNVLMIGDVVSADGCEFMLNNLQRVKSEYNITVCIANGENSAVGNGILPQSANMLFNSGVDIITGGNHSFKRHEIMNYYDENKAILRPANYPKGCVGNGYYIYDGGRYSILVINLQGRSYLEPLDCPFKAAEAIINENKATFTIIDFHAEATGEKQALARYLDGRVTAVCGTHTHVQTADEQILPKGTAYISDLGFTGSINSILGVKAEKVIEKFITSMPVRFESGGGACKMEGVILELDEKAGRCYNISRICVK